MSDVGPGAVDGEIPDEANLLAQRRPYGRSVGLPLTTKVAVASGHLRNVCRSDPLDDPQASSFRPPVPLYLGR